MKHLEEIIAQLSEFVKERVKDCAPKSLRKGRKPYKKTGPSVFILDRTPGLKKFFRKPANPLFSSSRRCLLKLTFSTIFFAQRRDPASILLF